MSAPQDEAQGQVQYAYLASLGRGLPEQLLAQGMLMPNGSHLFPAGQYKNCNCKKAKCLKLYCVCFQAGVYCNGCSCTDCQNLQVNDELITRERNRIVQREGPQAFGRKNAIQAAGVHLKGCRCSRSKCAKKYCECYDYQVPCSEMCKCKDCKNPKNKDIGMPRFAVTAAQQQQLLMAMQQKQLGGDAMEVDAAGMLQMQLMQQQGQIRLEDLSGVGGPVHSDTLPTSQPGSRPTLQPNSRPDSPAVPQQALMQPVLQQLPSLPHPKRRPSAAGQISNSSRLQRLLQPPAARHSLATASPPLSQGAAETATGLASGAQDIAHTAGMQLLQQYGQWLQMPTHTTGLSALAAAASEEQTMTGMPQQHFLAAQGKGPTSQAAVFASAAPTAGMEVKPRCASEQPVVAAEGQSIGGSRPGFMSNTSSREQSLEPRPTCVAAAAPRVAAAELEQPCPGVDSGRDVSPQALTEPGDAATAAAMHIPTAVHRLAHSVKMEPDMGVISADDSSAELQTSLPLGQNCRGIAPGKGMQSRHFPLVGALVTAAGRQQQKDLPMQMQMHWDASSAAAKPLQQDTEQQMPGVQHDDVGPTAGMFTSNPEPAVTAAMQQLSSEQAVVASMPIQQQQQQLLAAVSSYMQQAPYVSTALAGTAGNLWTYESTERQHHQPFGVAIPAALAPGDSRMQSVNSVPAAAAVDRSHAQDLMQDAAAELKPAAAEAEDDLFSGGFNIAKLLDDPAAAAELARAVGLNETAADAAMHAAEFLQTLLKLHVGGPDSITAAEIVVEQQQLVLQRLLAGQQQLLAFQSSRRQPPPLMAGASGPQLAVLTDRPLAAVQAAAGSSRLSPAVHALQQQQLAAANSPMSGAAIAAPAPMPPTAGMYACVHGHPKGLAHSIGGVTCTPSPVTAYAYRPCGSMRGPSPLGPVNNFRARESGLQALIGPGKQHIHQQQQQHTPTAAPPAPPGPPGSGTSSAMPGSARSRMPLLPGSFRIAGNINSPALSNDSPAQPAVSAIDAAALSHLAALRCEQQHVDSPAGSISLAPANASLCQPEQHTAEMGTAATGTAGNEHTPVFVNSHKVSTDKQQQQQQQQVSMQSAEQVGPDEGQSAAAAATATAAAGVSPVVDFSMPPPSSVGAHTPLTECEVAAQMAAAAARIVSAPTPGLWQTQATTSVLNEEQSTEPDPVAAILGSFNGHGWPSLAGMTPAGLELASGSVRSVLAGLTSPFDPASFLSSPLPHMTSVLRDAATSGASGLRALGLRFSDITPVLLNLQHQGGEASTGASTGARRRGAASKGTSGVKALCAGWVQGDAAAAAAAGSAAAATADVSSVGAADDAPASGRKLDTDKAAARAAAAAVESSHEGVGLGGGGYDAGMSSLIAAANFVSTPGYDDEVPAKRRKQDVVTQQPPEHVQPDQQQPQLQQQSEQLPRAAAASWAVFQELDVKHAADGTADRALAAAAVVDGQPDSAGKNFSFTAQARRVLLPPPGTGRSSQQEHCVAYSSQQEAEQQLCGSDWGSQLPGGEPVPADAVASQQWQQRQQQQQGMGSSGVIDMQQQQEHLAAQHMQQWGSLQLTQQAMHNSTGSEVSESAASHQRQQRQQAPVNGLMPDRGMPAIAGAGDKLLGKPSCLAAGTAANSEHQAYDAVAAKSSPHKPPVAVVGFNIDHQELSMKSPPVNAKPPPAKVTADRSPSVDYHEYADAMLQLSRAV